MPVRQAAARRRHQHHRFVGDVGVCRRGSVLLLRPFRRATFLNRCLKAIFVESVKRDPSLRESSSGMPRNPIGVIIIGVVIQVLSLAIWTWLQGSGATSIVVFLAMRPTGVWRFGLDGLMAVMTVAYFLGLFQILY